APEPKRRQTPIASTSGSAPIQATIGEMQDAVGNGGDGGAVGNEESGAAFPRTVQKQTKQRPFALGVHLGGRFVGEEDSRVVHECDGEARASKFAARELVGERLRAPGQADRLKSGIYVGASARLTGKEERRKHVVFESELVLQVWTAGVCRHAAPGVGTARAAAGGSSSDRRWRPTRHQGH